MPNWFQSTRVVFAVLFCSASALDAQTPQVDVGVTYVAQRSLQVNTNQNFWMHGGSIELGAEVWKGLGIAADITGAHTNSINNQGVPLSLVTTTFGPRYRWHSGKKLSVYSQALIGIANGFDSVFPTPTGAQNSANSFALQVGGGLDYRISHHFAIRAIDAGWSRTQLPNSASNTQNALRLGAGVVLVVGGRHR
jgi:peptidoglycan-associated lipoprotein